MLASFHVTQAADLGGQALAIVVGLVIGFAALLLRNFRNRKNQPTGMQREDLIDELNRMRATGSGFHARLDYLRQQGLRDQVAEGLIIDADTESIADDLQNRQIIEKPWCTLEAPGNWRLAALDPALDADQFFSIEAAGSGIVSFSCFPRETEAVSLDKALEDAIEGMRKQLRQLELHENVNQWGALQGRGIRVSGLIKTHPVRATFVLFACNQHGRLIAIQQGGLEGSKSRHQAAYDLIASSLKVFSE